MSFLKFILRTVLLSTVVTPQLKTSKLQRLILTVISFTDAELCLHLPQGELLQPSSRFKENKLHIVFKFMYDKRKWCNTTVTTSVFKRF